MSPQAVLLERKKNSIANYIHNCSTCQKRNQQAVKFAKSNFEVATFPMEFISMDLIGELYPPSKSGHKYALTVICMLTGYVFCIPFRIKSASEVVQAYINNVYAQFGGSLQILLDSGMEFNFLKACISKHISPHLELTEVVPLACASYHFVVWQRSCSPS